MSHIPGFHATNNQVTAMNSYTTFRLSNWRIPRKVATKYLNINLHLSQSNRGVTRLVVIVASAPTDAKILKFK